MSLWMSFYLFEKGTCTESQLFMNTRYSLKELSGISTRMISGGEYAPTVQLRYCIVTRFLIFKAHQIVMMHSCEAEHPDCQI